MNIFRRACSRIRDRERGRKSWYLSYDQFNEIKKGEGVSGVGIKEERWRAFTSALPIKSHSCAGRNYLKQTAL